MAYKLIESLFSVGIHLLIVTNTVSVVHIIRYIHRRPRKIMKIFAEYKVGQHQ